MKPTGLDFAAFCLQTAWRGDKLAKNRLKPRSTNHYQYGRTWSPWHNAVDVESLQRLLWLNVPLSKSYVFVGTQAFVEEAFVEVTLEIAAERTSHRHCLFSCR